MRKLLLILLCFPFLVFSQDEKRLALVIGNANYDKGPLKNPVNDALLIAETLKQLEFDVILDTNIADKASFIRTIREFGEKRSEYDIAFIYYAGHGIQVGVENFLLPTKEVFQSEYDVQDYGVSVQNILRYLTGMTNQVNILVLDACRDNPFEQNWNKTRSLKGSGLAKMKAPTGSLIAFSTDIGATAADGDGKNSVYCKHLAKNLLQKNIQIETVFKNVRSELSILGQYPIEENRLIGDLMLNYDPSFKFDYIENSFFTGTNTHVLNYLSTGSNPLDEIYESSYTIELTINNLRMNKISGIVKYPSLGCSGHLVLLNYVKDKRYDFVEKITKNKVDCVQNGTVTLEVINDNQVLWYWYHGEDHHSGPWHIPAGQLGSATILNKQDIK